VRVEGLFNLFDGYLKVQGYLAMSGQIIDATIVPAPRQRNSRDDNATVKSGKTPTAPIAARRPRRSWPHAG